MSSSASSGSSSSVSPRRRPPRLSLDPDVGASHNLSVIQGTPLIISGKEVILIPSLLTSLSVTHIINCLPPYPPLPGFTYLHLSLEDKVEYDPSWCFPQVLSFIGTVPPESKCLIHCNAGMSRSVLLAMVYLAAPPRSLTALEALAKVREDRPQASPNEGFMKVVDDGSVDLEVYARDRFADVKDLGKGNGKGEGGGMGEEKR